jgi:hypothetical protein
VAEMRSCPLWDVTRHILVFSDVWEQPVGPVLKDQAVQEDGNDRLSRNVAKYQYTAHNLPEERRSLIKMLAARGEMDSFQLITNYSKT